MNECALYMTQAAARGAALIDPCFMARALAWVHLAKDNPLLGVLMVLKFGGAVQAFALGVLIYESWFYWDIPQRLESWGGRERWQQYKAKKRGNQHE